MKLRKDRLLEYISWIIFIGVPAIMAWVILYGYLPKDSIFTILFIIFFILSGMTILLNNSIRHELYKERNAKLNAALEISKLLSLITNISEFPYKNGRSFDRQTQENLRAAIAKNGKIPLGFKKTITQLNEKDVKLGEQFDEIIEELIEHGLIEP